MTLKAWVKALTTTGKLVLASPSASISSRCFTAQALRSPHGRRKGHRGKNFCSFHVLEIFTYRFQVHGDTALGRNADGGIMNMLFFCFGALGENSLRKEEALPMSESCSSTVGCSLSMMAFNSSARGLISLGTATSLIDELVDNWRSLPAQKCGAVHNFPRIIKGLLAPEHGLGITNLCVVPFLVWPSYRWSSFYC